jgi:starch synthase (maltosyl-transferring)
MKTFDHSPGLIVYNLFPLLVGPPGAWAGHLSRIRHMGFDTVFVNPFHLAGCSGSIYSIKDTGLLDPRFQYAPGDGDEVIQQFCERARRNDLSVMIDLVVNHAARDSVLVATRPEFFARERDGGLVTPWAMDIGSETGKVFWHDLALFTYADPVAKGLLINHWDTYIARFQRLGVSSFRCDAAHMVPADVWLELISRAKTREPDCIFVAETLGCTLETAVEIAQVGFGYIMSNFAYSEFTDLRALVEYEHYTSLRPRSHFRRAMTPNGWRRASIPTI